VNPRRRITWIVYALCVALLAQGLAWVTWQVVRLERREAQARVLNDRREGERLALWRMDSLVAPLIARESARPYFHYRAFVPAGRAYETMWQPAPDGAALVPSPLLTDPDQRPDGSGRFVRLHFLIDPDGRVTSPEAPTDEEIARAAGAAGLPTIDYAGVDQAASRLGTLAGLLADSASSLGAVAAEAQQKAAPEPASRAAGLADSLAEGAQREDRSFQEYNFRAQIADYARNNDARPRAAPAPAVAAEEPHPETALAYDSVRDEAVPEDATPAASKRALADANGLAIPKRVATSPIRVGSFDPVWLAGHELALVREVSVDGVSYRQGVWLDWAALRAELLAAQKDLFPKSTLKPITDAEAPADPADAARRLATIPVRYVPGDAWTLPRAGMTPARWSLVVTWVAVLAAVVAIGVVLHTSIQLSERRGRFVSAVTHELRTPLTTFRLYAQMLADGMVTDEGARSEYLATLKRESGRLSGIVENVLEYARLSRRAAGRPKAVGPISPEDLLVRLRPTLSRRAEQGGMDLIVSPELEGAAGRVVHVDPQSVERILTNLIDNACKYAAPEGADDADTRIHLDVRTTATELEVLVADYGPGVPPADRARIFGEFRRGAGGERSDRSGLGLGLALSRGLAREAGGDLRLVRRRGHGAEFLLTLPLVERGGG